MKSEVLAALRSTGVVAVIRTENPGDLVAVARALSKGGVRFVEITLTVPGALDIIREAATQLKDDQVYIGAGTVLEVAMARAAVTAGAEFIVGPGYDAETVKFCNGAGIVVMPGAFTPHEVLQAWKGGADVVKLFPADLGGPDYIRTIKEPLPKVEILPTKGIDFETAEAYLRAGAVAVGAGSALVSKALIASRDYARITENAARFRAIVRQVRGA